MNEQNLIPTSQLSESEARELGRKGGIASGAARRARKTMRERLTILGDEEITSKDGITKQREDVIALQIAAKAANGDLKAARLYNELMGYLKENGQDGTTIVNVIDYGIR